MIKQLNELLSRKGMYESPDATVAQMRLGGGVLTVSTFDPNTLQVDDYDVSDDNDSWN